MKNKLQRQKVAIIDYGSGNLRSAEKAFQKVIADHNLVFDVVVTSDVRDVQGASHIVLPGQGAFGDCMRGLQAVPDMINTLAEEVLVQKKPFLGICVGMQLLADRGLEHGEHKGLGWIPGQIVPIKPEDPSIKIPHMGWNTISVQRSHFMTKNHENLEPHFYFVHSFMFESNEGHENTDHVLATTQYGNASIPVIIGDKNIIGIQCHPEKSQEAGLEFLHNFLLWNPETSM